MKQMDARLLDKKWRINHLYQIKNKESDKIQFKKNKAQDDFDNNKHSRNIILKSRQLGFTTFEAIDSFDDTLFNKNFSSLIINYEQKEAIRIFSEKITFLWDNLPDMIKGLVTVDTNRANQLTFNLGDGSVSSIAVAMEGRGGTFNRVHITELGKLCREYPRRANMLIESVMPSVPLKGRIDIESTAEGSDGLFYKMFWEAWNRKRPPYPTEFKAHFYNWTWDDEIKTNPIVIPVEDMEQSKTFLEYADKHSLSKEQISYYYLRWLSVNKDWNKMRQEYPTTPEEAFIGSGNKMFMESDLEYLKYTVKDGEQVEDWTFYEPYIDSHFYTMGCDVAEGVGQDSSTAVILDVTEDKSRVVAEYASNKIPPDIFAYEIVRGANKYGNPIVGVERNNTGHTTLTVLKGIYSNIYTEVKEDKVADTVTEKLGWWTSQYSKPKMMYELAQCIREKMIDISSRKILEELRTYDKDDVRKSKFDPEKTNHWDMIMALAIAFQMKSFAYQVDEMEFHNL